MSKTKLIENIPPAIFRDLYDELKELFEPEVSNDDKTGEKSVKQIDEQIVNWAKNKQNDKA